MKPAKTPEEAVWMASVLDPSKAKRRLKYGYILLCVWIAASIAYMIVLIARKEPVSWSDGISGLVIVMGYIGAITGIVNNRRIASGKKPMNF